MKSNQAATRKKSFFSFFLKALKWLFLSCLLLVFVAALGGYLFYLNVSKDLPKLDKIEDYQPPVMAEVFDDSGKKIGEFWKEARILTPIDQIPKKMIEGFVASEDERFFKHGGVDPYGIIRAFWSNLQAGHVVQGASTITQQVTKALLLSPEKTYDRKIKEAILATKIEKNFSKDQILYIYLNQIFLGNRAYGVAAAARNYFHKDLKDLNIAEIAMIVGLAKGPSSFNPLINPDRATQRMHYVVDRMKDVGYISAEEAEEAKKYPLKIYKAATDKDFNIKYAPYFVEYVRRHLQKKYGDQLYTGGWKIYTTANLEMNQEAQRAVQEGVAKFSKRFGYRGPLKHFENQSEIDRYLHDEHIKLLEEEDKINYFGDPELKQASAIVTPLYPDQMYNAVITGIEDNNLKIRVGNVEGLIAKEDYAWAKTPAKKAQAWRASVGDVIEVKLKITKNKKENAALTTLKAFTMEQRSEVQAALYSYEPFTGAIKTIIGGQDFRYSEFNRATQALRQPGSAIKPFIYAAALDKGYTPGTVIMDSPIAYQDGSKIWSPKNYGGKYYGPTAFRHALVNSRNVVTVRILMDIGTHYATGFIRKFGISTPIYKYYSMALGSNEVYLEELARAYGTFVTGGITPDTHFIQKIEGPHHKVVEEYQLASTPYLISYKPVANKAKPGENPPTESSPSESRPTSLPSKSVGESGYNPKLLQNGEASIQRDQLALTEYEKKVLYGSYIPEGYTITPKTAITMVNILRDVVRAGTATRVLALGKPAGGKTGTTNGETDAWFMGFTPNLVTGVWVGFDEKIKSLPRGSTGGSTAAPIWLAYMKEATEKYPTLDFTIPKWVDLSVYEAPIENTAVGDAELGEAGVGTGVQSSGNNNSGGAEFFIQDLE